MNILVRSTYPQSDSWGKAAQAYIKAFMSAGLNVQGDPLILGSRLDKDVSWVPTDKLDCDISFQQCFPEMFTQPTKKNIGFCFTETLTINQMWVSQFNKMDEVWVATELEKSNLEKSGVYKPIHTVPMPMNFTRGKKVSPLVEKINGRFSFYFVGEFVERKNIDKLVQAYWREFSTKDDVVLLLKVNFGDVDSGELNKYLGSFISKLDKLYRLNKDLPEILLITDWIENIEDIHETCDCFITASHGESTCMPLLDAAFHNNIIVCPHKISAVDRDLVIHTFNSYEVPCVVSNPPLQYLYSSNETWVDIDILSMQRKMRAAVNGYLQKNFVDVEQKYSIENVGKIIKSLVS